MNIRPREYDSKNGIPKCSQQDGAALAEYAIVTFLFVLALIGGPNVMHQLMQAMSDAYQSFLFALSAP